MAKIEAQRRKMQEVGKYSRLKSSTRYYDAPSSRSTTRRRRSPPRRLPSVRRSAGSRRSTSGRACCPERAAGRGGGSTRQRRRQGQQRPRTPPGDPSRHSGEVCSYGSSSWQIFRKEYIYLPGRLGVCQEDLYSFLKICQEYEPSSYPHSLSTFTTNALSDYNPLMGDAGGSGYRPSGGRRPNNMRGG